jgi:hypothetical protein
MTKDEALKLALEALELVNIEFVCGNGSHNAKKDRHEWDEPCPITDRWKKAITAIKEALAQPEHGWTPERIAGMSRLKETQDKKLAQPNFCPRCGKRLGTNDWDIHTCTPPQRTWVGLTDEEIDKAWRSVDHTIPYAQFRIDVAKAVEAKLKEKNNG